MKSTTLCYITRGDRVLMLHRTKKEGDMNRDKWLGIGGKLEENESPDDCLLREALEETGLTVTLLDGFRAEDYHPFACDGETRMKHVVYFLAKYAHQTPTAQASELDSIRLMDYDAAMNAFQFENPRRILSEAHQFLTTKLW